jgi:hypothetical protein
MNGASLKTTLLAPDGPLPNSINRDNRDRPEEVPALEEMQYEA